MAVSGPVLNLPKLLSFVDHQSVCNVIEKYITFYFNKRTTQESEKSLYSSLEDYLSCSVANIPGEYSRESLLVDTLHDTMLHGAKKGLNVREIQAFAAIVLKLLLAVSEESVDVREREEVVKHLVSIMQKYIQHLTPLAVSTIVAYVNITILQHLHLYSHLVSEEQELDYTELACTVHPACEVLPLRDGITEAEWETKQRLAKVVAKYNKIREEFESQKLENVEVNEECMKNLQSQLQKCFPDDDGVTIDKLQTAIDSLLGGHAQLVETDLLTMVREIEMETNFKIEKTEALSPKKILSQ